MSLNKGLPVGAKEKLPRKLDKISKMLSKSYKKQRLESSFDFHDERLKKRKKTNTRLKPITDFSGRRIGNKI